VHNLILGRTGSGKSTLARELIRIMKQKFGMLSIVFDPFMDPKWKEVGAEYVTNSQEEFLKRAKAWRKFHLVIDEASTTIGTHNPEMMWCATMGRHFGHLCTFITQRASTLNRTVREQCSRYFIFKCGRKDAKTLAEDYGPEVAEAWRLAMGEFLDIPNFGEVTKRRIF
jgi:DNA helicase HerA-like ATPase